MSLGEDIRKLKALARAAEESSWNGPDMEVFVDALLESGAIRPPPSSSKEGIEAAARVWANEWALRGTGRTTRMLENAIEIAASGGRVIVLAVDDIHRERLTNALASLTNDSSVYERIRVAVTADAHRDRSLFGRATILEDHYTIEVRQRRGVCGARDAAWPDTPPCSLPRGHEGSHTSERVIDQTGARGYYSWPTD